MRYWHFTVSSTLKSTHLNQNCPQKPTEHFIPRRAESEQAAEGDAGIKNTHGTATAAKVVRSGGEEKTGEERESN